jgi:hypothetical protein
MSLRLFKPFKTMPPRTDWEMADGAFANVLDSHQALDISHEGGEFEALADLEC